MLMADRQLAKEIIHARWGGATLVMGCGMALLHLVHVTV